MDRYSKTSYDVTVEKVEPGTEVYNKLEDCSYTTTEDRCYVITGTVGEQWPVTKEKLEKAYCMPGDEQKAIDFDKLENGPVTLSTIVSQEKQYIHAERLKIEDGPFSVKTSWGDILVANRDGIDHGAGDFLVCSLKEDGSPNYDDKWVVNGLVFEKTYEPEKEPDIGSKEVREM